ncbi:succinate dehydrogenase subunit 6, mitochondrial-like isoform X2 [Zingiber officinale]|uniref:succinate dehydrogenase subunit 6, mitochondrial-like isoform X2 n=1 Tax=Zingiber officinale TaxID=94328 RepID=UPI001C4B8555|nr:succinate dehydrogenase subunit 6, mitochondrial-like isoform X2 [Zingiber officinale]
MAESSDSSPLGFLWKHLEEVKEHWRSNFAFLDYYRKSLGRKEPLPKWTDADVEEFIASDPVYGPQLKAIRQSRKYAVAGGLLGAAHLGGVSLKYSKSPHVHLHSRYAFSFLTVSDLLEQSLLS